MVNWDVAEAEVLDEGGSQETSRDFLSTGEEGPSHPEEILMATRKPSKKAKSLFDEWFGMDARDAVATLVEELQEINKKQVGRKK